MLIELQKKTEKNHHHQASFNGDNRKQIGYKIIKYIQILTVPTEEAMENIETGLHY